MGDEHWWLVSEALSPGSMPDDADTRPMRPESDVHVPSEWAGAGDGCDGDVCGWWPCECDATPDPTTEGGQDE